MSTIRFKNDTATRKRFFHPDSMSHPAKLHSGLFLEIMERYTSPGDTILDPMGGIGTALLAAMYGRSVILNELEAHFIEPMVKSWAKIQQHGPALGHTLGQVYIIRGDARHLPLSSADSIITSPPYESALTEGKDGIDRTRNKFGRKDEGYINYHYEGYTRPSAIITSPPFHDTGNAVPPKAPDGKDNGQLARLRRGLGWTGGQGYTRPVDAVISSPPYEGSLQGDEPSGKLFDTERRVNSPASGNRKSKRKPLGQGYTAPVDAIVSSPPYANRLADTYVDDDPQRMSYEMGKAKIDAVVSSPPYEGSLNTVDNGIDWTKSKRDGDVTHWPSKELGKSSNPKMAYADVGTNIGNQKNDAYWESMRLVFQECHRVLKPQGVMALVLKGFTRDGKYVDLPQQTADLVESLGFTLFDRWKRELWSLSFWRILQKRRDPAAFDERLMYEEVLAFRKEGQVSESLEQEVSAVITSPPWQESSASGHDNNTTWFDKHPEIARRGGGTVQNRYSSGYTRPAPDAKEHGEERL